MLASELADEIRTRRGFDPHSVGRDAEILRQIVDDAEALANPAAGAPDPRVVLWKLHESFRELDGRMRRTRAGLVIDQAYQPLALETFERRVAELFASRSLEARTSASSALRPLMESLGIKRFATLNYDLEIERALMLRADERRLLGAPNEDDEEVAGVVETPDAEPVSPAGRENFRSVTRYIGPPESGRPIVRMSPNRLSRTMGHGMVVESDIVDRERPDRLFEFAVGSSETAAHVLHLHGRADVPGSLIANIRQYDRLYRLDDLYRDPFDHSLKVLFGGNPILFVGIGMTEEELNRTLQYYVSNAPVRRPAPMFLIWNTTRIAPGQKGRFMRDRRLDFRRRLGVHVIFEEDLRAPEGSGPFIEGEPPDPVPADSIVAIDQLARDLPRRLRELLVPFKEINGLKGLPSELAEFTDVAVRLGSILDGLKSIPTDPIRNMEEAEEAALVRTLARLPRLISRIDQLGPRPDAWRMIDRRFAIPRVPPSGHHMWGAIGLSELAGESDSDAELDRLHGQAPGEDSPVVFAAARAGFGRGELGERLMRMSQRELIIDRMRIRTTLHDNRLLINAGFSYDSDAVLVGITRFLAQRLSPPMPVVSCREALIASGELFNTVSNVLIVINGADRFFGFDGTPLSAELDHMLRCAMKGGRVQFLLLGTERLRPYCEAVGSTLQSIATADREGTREEPPFTSRLQQVAGRTQDPLRSKYLDWIARRFMERACWARANPPKTTRGRPHAFPADFDITSASAKRIRDALNANPEQLTRAFYDAYLSPALLGALQVNCPGTFEVLRTMSFIGAPVEAAVLLYAPKVRAILGETSKGTDRLPDKEIQKALEGVIRDLRALGLVIAFEPHDEPHTDASADGEANLAAADSDAGSGAEILNTRFGLHRSLAVYLRDRHGVPINDAKLATTFNMSLFMSEPSDNYSPEPGFHDELGRLVDDLVGAWHDVHRYRSAHGTSVMTAEQCAGVSEAALQPMALHPDDAEAARNSLDARSSRIASACLRAALSLVRGYYSTSTLLKFDREDRLAQPDRDGALTEHAQRLDRIIHGFASTVAARAIVRAATRIGDAPSAEAAKHMGPEPFYQDDLVWLQNERGVVALAQGHLFDATKAFGDARTTNRLIEPNFHGHNWRRISLNIVATLIERADLKAAERLLDRIEETINAPVWRKLPARERSTRVESIRALLRRSETAPTRGDEGHTREELLVTAMVTGYRGLIAQVRGRYHEAKAWYLSGTKMLRRLGEHRAYAHFQRHYAALQSFIGDKDSARLEIEYGIAAAVSARQMDILHRSNVVRADVLHSTNSDPHVRRNALEDVKKALKYSTLSDCYRARIEASASLARHMRHGGDYDTALRYAADALTIASRYGHSLQKTSLRIEIGRILQQRGDPRSGKALLDKAVEIGAGKGHQQALERVRRADSDDAPPPGPSNRTDIPVSS